MRESFITSTTDVSPRQVAIALGVSESAVKRWCDQGLLPLARTPGGHRRISSVAVLRFARDRGREVRDGAALLAADAAMPKPLGMARAELRRGLLAADGAAVRATLESQWLGGQSVDVLCDELITPVFVEIGERWSRGALEIYEERRAGELVRRCLDDLGARLSPPARSAPSALGGTLENDPYWLPTTMSELVLRERGFEARSLGIGLPAATMARAIADGKPRLVWLAVGACADERRVVAECGVLERAARAVGAALVVGGRALVPALRRQLRYSAFCDGMAQLASFAEALVPRAAPGSKR
jgi:excisionase family DNA binding protein